MSSPTVPVFGPNDWFVQEKYQDFLADPASVDSTWRDFFAQTGVGSPATADIATASAAAAPSASRANDPKVSTAVSTSSARPPGGPPPPPPPPRRSRPVPVNIRSRPTAPAAPARVGGKEATDSAPPVARPARPTTTATPDDMVAAKAAKAARAAQDAEGDGLTTTTLRGVAAAVVKNMTSSLEVPTATSVRAVPAKLMADNRIVINNFLKRNRGGKISFTHLIGYAIVRAIGDYPNMNRHFAVTDGKPSMVTPAHVNLGLAIDLPAKGGGRNLVVIPIKSAEAMSFTQFWSSYEQVVRKARAGSLTAEDYAGTTISLTNPGGIGTNHSVPRLMSGQSAIIGVGALEYPAEFQGASDQTLSELGISKIMTLTSTYDHRVIQGAESGEFLRRIHQLLIGEDGFYDDVFTSLRLPYEPVRWVKDLDIGRHGAVDKTARVLEIIDAYRTRGHLMADTDPLNYRQRRHPDLDVLSHGLTLWDLDREFPVGGFNDQDFMKLRDVLGVLRDSYCRTVGVEYMHIMDPAQRKWIQQRVEVKHEKPPIDEQKYILGRLNSAEAFETFLQTKYIGQKRFSLEGGETVIALLDAALNKAAEYGMDEVVLGMAHRGRLNVLANIVGKPYSQIFREFEGNMDPGQAHGSGDVKYHLGAEGKYIRPFGDGQVDVTLVANPSHLEVVDPVLEGVARAKQDMLNLGEEGFTVMPIALHGDAAFAGQGVVAETLQLSLLRGYRTGGTLHVIINNQVGFTTAPEASRSSEYCTDVAKMIQAPIFHVNGDDPEAAVWVSRLAVEYRQTFGRDVVIDMVCYRRRGHNEGDDPSMTNPLMYQIIDGKRSVRRIYTEALIGRGDLSPEDAEEVSARLPHPTGTGLQRGPRPGEGRRHPVAVGRGQAAGSVWHRHQDHGGDAAADRGRRSGVPGRLHPTPQGEKGAGTAGRDVPGRRHRLGVRRVGCAGGYRDRRSAGPLLRAGHQARHLRAAALGADRLQDRRRISTAATSFRRSGTGTDLRLGTHRICSTRFRIRLLGRPPGRTGDLGGPVRRLRQRRPIGHRRVPVLRRGQMGTEIHRRFAAAAWP